MFVSKLMTDYRLADPQPSWYTDLRWKVYQLHEVHSYKTEAFSTGRA